MLNTSLTARPLFGVSRLNEIARKTGLVTRNSKKFSPGNFLLALLKSVCSGKAFFNQLAMSLSSATPAVCKQAVHKRINRFAVAFLLQVISGLITNDSTKTLDEFVSSGFHAYPRRGFHHPAAAQNQRNPLFPSSDPAIGFSTTFTPKANSYQCSHSNS